MKTIDELKSEIAELRAEIDRLNAIRESELIEHREAVEGLRKSELKYRTIFDNVQDVFYQTDLSGTIHEISPSIKYFTEFSAEDLVGKSVSTIYQDPADRATLLEILGRDGEVRDYEIKLKTREGNTKYVSINARLVFDDQALPSHIDGSLRDITARRLAQEITAKREEELNHAQKLAKMGSWNFDLLTGKNIWSKNMSALLGMPEEEHEISYQNFLAMVHPDDRNLFNEYLKIFSNTKESVQFDFRHVLANGEVKWFQNNVEPIFVEDKLVALKGVNVDITDHKKADLELIEAKERAEASDRLKTAFMNNISHEIRTPLNAIQGFAPMIIEPGISLEEKQELIEIMNLSTERLVQTVTDYMDISLLTSGNVEPVYRDFRIEDLLGELEGTYKEKCWQKELEWRIDTSGISSCSRMHTDKTLITKILGHLLDNAVKFTAVGNISIKVSKKGRWYEFCIKDSGIGINEKALTKIFSHFVQEDESSRRSYEGSGLGLAIVNGLVTLLGGKIWCESAKGEGSAFFFTIPVKEGKQEMGDSQSDQDITPAPTQSNILIVEDDHFSYRFLERVLQNDFQVSRAENGQVALEMIRNSPNLAMVLLDVRLPGMDGYEVARRIREIDQRLVIVAQTAHGLQGEREKALQAGCNEYISKPINLSELRQIICKYLE